MATVFRFHESRATTPYHKLPAAAFRCFCFYCTVAVARHCYRRKKIRVRTLNLPRFARTAGSTTTPAAIRATNAGASRRGPARTRSSAARFPRGRPAGTRAAGTRPAAPAAGTCAACRERSADGGSRCKANRGYHRNNSNKDLKLASFSSKLECLLIFTTESNKRQHIVKHD